MASRQFAVLGLGRFGSTVARALYEAGAEVVAVDEREEVVEAIKNHVTTAIVMDATQQEALTSLDLGLFDAVVVAMGKDMEAGTLVTALLRQEGARRIVARASSDLHARILEMVGADEVVYPERDLAHRVTSKLLSPSLVDVVELSGKLELAVLEVPEAFVGQSLAQLRLRNRYGVTVLAVERSEEGGALELPGADFAFAAGQRMYVVGPAEEIQRLATQG